MGDREEERKGGRNLGWGKNIEKKEEVMNEGRGKESKGVYVFLTILIISRTIRADIPLETSCLFPRNPSFLAFERT